MYGTLNIGLKNKCEWLKQDLFKLNHRLRAVFTGGPDSHTDRLKQVVVEMRLAGVLEKI